MPNNGIPPGPDKGRIIHFTVNTLYSSYCKRDHAKCLAGIIFKKDLKAIYNLNDWIDTADSIKAILQLHKTSIFLQVLTSCILIASIPTVLQPTYRQGKAA